MIGMSILVNMYRCFYQGPKVTGKLSLRGAKLNGGALDCIREAQVRLLPPRAQEARDE